MASSFKRCLDHTHQRTTFGRTPMGEWSARRRDLNVTSHTTLKTDKRPWPGGIQTHSLRMRAAVDLRLRQRPLGPTRKLMKYNNFTGMYLIIFLCIHLMVLVKPKRVARHKNDINLTLFDSRYFYVYYSFSIVIMTHQYTSHSGFYTIS